VTSSPANRRSTCWRPVRALQAQSGPGEEVVALHLTRCRVMHDTWVR
jgi:hypothetical protein